MRSQKHLPTGHYSMPWQQTDLAPHPNRYLSSKIHTTSTCNTFRHHGFPSLFNNIQECGTCSRLTLSIPRIFWLRAFPPLCCDLQELEIFQICTDSTTQKAKNERFLPIHNTTEFWIWNNNKFMWNGEVSNQRKQSFTLRTSNKQFQNAIM